MTPAARARTMTGSQLQQNVLDRCAWYGLHTAHFRPALTRSGHWITAVAGDGKGWPDLVIVGPGGILYREIKSAAETVRPAQAAWIVWLGESGANVAVWRPADLHSGLIDTELQKLRTGKD